MSSTSLPPTAAQVRYLRTLAAPAGQTLATPRTRRMHRRRSVGSRPFGRQASRSRSCRQGRPTARRTAM